MWNTALFILYNILKSKHLTNWGTNIENRQIQTSCEQEDALLPGRKETDPVLPTCKVKT